VSKQRNVNDFLPPTTKVELIGIHKETGQAYRKIIELQDFKTIEKKENFNYLPPYQIGFSQFKDVINI
jgi:hypothetical protein